MKNTFNVYLKICELGDKCLKIVQKIKVFAQAFNSLGLWEITTNNDFVPIPRIEKRFFFLFLTNSCLIMSEKKLKFRFEPIKHLYRFRKIDSKSSIVSHVSNVSRSEAECRQKRKYWERVAAN